MSTALFLFHLKNDILVMIILQRSIEMTKIIIATTNEGKMKEFRALLAHKDVEILSMKEAGINIEIEENGKTFDENSAIKAKKQCVNIQAACVYQMTAALKLIISEASRVYIQLVILDTIRRMK